MKYYEVDFLFNVKHTAHNAQLSDACDLLAALAGEAGFETFEETDKGLKGYVQQSLFDEGVLREAIADFPFEGITISYEVREAEDRDWNEQWEQEGFEPIDVRCVTEDGRWKSLIIHDGRHLPSDISLQSSVAEIEIDAKQAFGTGTHETTRMICAYLVSFHHPSSIIDSARVLDCGTGTGILSICALKLGAREAIGYDIDEWSVDNARHNAVINRVDDRFDSLLGDATILDKVEGSFDIIMANINRNILLNDLPKFREKLADGGHIILSGFLHDDISVLTDKARTLGLRCVGQNEDGEWASILLTPDLPNI